MTPDGPPTDTPRHDVQPRSNSDLADYFLIIHQPLDWARDPIEGSNVNNIDSARVPQLTEDIVDLIAHIVAGILDAGSERDAVNENEDLHRVIEAELKGWTREANS